MTEDELLAKPPPLIIHMLYNCLASFIALIISPALPDIAEYFQLSKAMAKLSMSYYLVGYALGVLFYAPLTSRFGRKFSLYVGLTIAIIGCIICILSKSLVSFYLFNAGRFILAIGATAGIQVAFTMIADCYKPPKSLQISAFLMLSFASGPSIGVVIGGALTGIGWHLIFYFVLLYLIALLLLTKFFVTETMKIPDLEALKFKRICKNFYHNLIDPRVLSSSFLLGSAVVFNYVFLTASPFIVISMMKVPPEIFGFYNLIPPIGLILGSFLSIWFVKKIGPHKLIWMGISIMTIMSVVMFFMMLFQKSLHPLFIFLPFTIILVGQALISANVYGLCMHHHPHKSQASALLNFVNLSICSFFTFTLSLFNKSHDLILPIYFMGFSVLLFVFGGFFQNIMKKQDKF